MPKWSKHFEALRLSVSLAAKSMRTNLLRTSLSLLGISIGIFTVSAIYTGVDSLNHFLIKSLDKFGNNTLFIDRFNYKNMGNMNWAKIRKMKKSDYREFLFLKENLPENTYKAINFRMVIPQVPVKYKNQKNLITLVSDTYQVADIMQFNLAHGRFYGKMEDQKGLPVAVIGAEVAEALFPGENPLGKELNIFGNKVQVIGILKKDTGMIQINPSNNQIFVPYQFIRKYFPQEKRFYTTIMVLPQDISQIDKLKDRITLLLRKYRKLKPGQKNNFYVNNIDFLKEMVQKSIRTLRIAGWILGGFSLLVGAFGIANIMFVTVKERTREIGIQKALGAKKTVILTEFLSESVLLALTGGLLGFLFLYLSIILMNKLAPEFELILTPKNILIAFFVSLIIGLLAGILPARQAASLNPIDAIRRS